MKRCDVCGKPRREGGRLWSNARCNPCLACRRWVYRLITAMFPNDYDHQLFVIDAYQTDWKNAESE